jgi:hypothetical protein
MKSGYSAGTAAADVAWAAHVKMSQLRTGAFAAVHARLKQQRESPRARYWASQQRESRWVGFLGRWKAP